MVSLPDGLAKELMGRLQAHPWTAVVVFVALAWVASLYSRPRSKYPTINDHAGWTSQGAKSDYVANARMLVIQGFRKFSGPFNLITDHGSLLVLPPTYIDEVNAVPELDFKLYMKEEFLSDYETFKVWRPPPTMLFEDAVMKGLTRSLPRFTKDLSIEMASCLEESWGDSKEWHQVTLKTDLLAWVARMSTRIFLGPDFVRNEEWLRISVEMTVDAFTACFICKFLPRLLRWPTERLLPLCRKVRSDHRACSRILAPVLKQRRQEIATAQREGRKPNLPDDSIEWFRNASNGRAYDETDIQLGLAMAAIHTTSDLLCQTILNLCANPELFEPLRKEVVAVMQKHGWRKLALTELRLLDSVLKETQRIKPVEMMSMHRTATTDIQLPSGVIIKKGEKTAISSHRMWSPQDYEDPEKFDGYRFVERRKIPGYENRSLLVSTSHDHLGFAHGKHACPGRFFAANEAKIAMVHLLLKYDMKIDDPTEAQYKTYGVRMFSNGKAQIRIRKREPEIDLDNLAF